MITSGSYSLKKWGKTLHFRFIFPARFVCSKSFALVRKLSFRVNDAFAGCRHNNDAMLYFERQ